LIVAILEMCLETIPINLNTRLASLDITNTYTNIPTTEVIHILETELKKHVMTQK
jgi:hypothetical protein